MLRTSTEQATPPQQIKADAGNAPQPVESVETHPAQEWETKPSQAPPANIKETEETRLFHLYQAVFDNKNIADLISDYFPAARKELPLQLLPPRKPTDRITRILNDPTCWTTSAISTKSFELLLREFDAILNGKKTDMPQPGKLSELMSRTIMTMRQELPASQRSEAIFQIFKRIRLLPENSERAYQDLAYVAEHLNTTARLALLKQCMAHMYTLAPHEPVGKAFHFLFELIWDCTCNDARPLIEGAVTFFMQRPDLLSEMLSIAQVFQIRRQSGEHRPGLFRLFCTELLKIPAGVEGRIIRGLADSGWNIDSDGAELLLQLAIKSIDRDLLDIIDFGFRMPSDTSLYDVNRQRRFITKLAEKVSQEPGLDLLPSKPTANLKPNLLTALHIRYATDPQERNSLMDHLIDRMALMPPKDCAQLMTLVTRWLRVEQLVQLVRRLPPAHWPTFFEHADLFQLARGQCDNSAIRDLLVEKVASVPPQQRSRAMLAMLAGPELTSMAQWRALLRMLPGIPADDERWPEVIAALAQRLYRNYGIEPVGTDDWMQLFHHYLSRPIADVPGGPRSDKYVVAMHRLLAAFGWHRREFPVAVFSRICDALAAMPNPFGLSTSKAESHDSPVGSIPDHIDKSAPQKLAEQEHIWGATLEKLRLKILRLPPSQQGYAYRSLLAGMRGLGEASPWRFELWHKLLAMLPACPTQYRGTVAADLIRTLPGQLDPGVRGRRWMDLLQFTKESVPFDQRLDPYKALLNQLLAGNLPAEAFSDSFNALMELLPTMAGFEFQMADYSTKQALNEARSAMPPAAGHPGLAQINLAERLYVDFLKSKGYIT